jgi:hypothetical protein
LRRGRFCATLFFVAFFCLAAGIFFLAGLPGRRGLQAAYNSSKESCKHRA